VADAAGRASSIVTHGHRTSPAPRERAARAPAARNSRACDLSLHAATEWGDDPQRSTRCHADIAQGDIIVATMLFMEDHIQRGPAGAAARGASTATRSSCAMSAGEVVRLTRHRSLRHGQAGQRADGAAQAPARLARAQPATAARRQMTHAAPPARRSCASSRAPPRTCAPTSSTLQYWLAGSDDNVANMVRFLVEPLCRRPAAGAARHAQGRSRRSSTRRSASTTRACPAGIADAAARLPPPARAVRGTVGAAAACAPMCWPATPAITTA
jgi:magnesium chelatase subunit H